MLVSKRRMFQKAYFPNHKFGIPNDDLKSVNQKTAKSASKIDQIKEKYSSVPHLSPSRNKAEVATLSKVAPFLPHIDADQGSGTSEEERSPDGLKHKHNIIVRIVPKKKPYRIKRHDAAEPHSSGQALIIKEREKIEQLILKNSLIACESNDITI